LSAGLAPPETQEGQSGDGRHLAANTLPPHFTTPLTIVVGGADTWFKV
jgi:hypothetical protein